MNKGSDATGRSEAGASFEERLRSVRRPLVTGATGFLGGWLLAFLESYGVSAAGLARNGRPRSGDHPGTQGSAGAEIFDADVRDLRRLNEVFGEVRPDYVYHLAGARCREPTPSALEELVSINVGGTANVLMAAQAAGCKRVLIAGTAEEYGPIGTPFGEGDRESPSNLYGVTKLAATRMAITFGELTGLAVTVVRTTVAYGPGQGKDMFIGALLKCLGAGERFAMTSGLQKKDFIYVADVVEGIVRVSLEDGAAGRILNLGTGVPTSVRDAAELAQKTAGKDGLLGFGEIPMRKGEILEYVVDMSTTTRLLGWSPRVSLAEGLSRTVRAAGL